jgi:hypothetical protein
MLFKQIVIRGLCATFAVVVIAQAVIAVGIGFVWARSYRLTDLVMWLGPAEGRDQNALTISSRWGMLYVSREYMWGPGHAPVPSSVAGTRAVVARKQAHWRFMSVPAPTGAHRSPQYGMWPPAFSSVRRPATVGLSWWELHVPLWIPALSNAVLPAWLLLARYGRRRRRRRRIRLGLCPRCAYDLRGSVAGCPECGWTCDSAARSQPK